MKEEMREEEKKKKIEQKMAQIDEKNDKVRREFNDSELSVSKESSFGNWMDALTQMSGHCSVMQRRRPRRGWLLNVWRSWS